MTREALHDRDADYAPVSAEWDDRARRRNDLARLVGEDICSAYGGGACDDFEQRVDEAVALTGLSRATAGAQVMIGWETALMRAPGCNN